MKMFDKVNQVETTIDTGQVKSFTINQNKHMFKILSDGIYSDKPLAVVRELGCNAWDSHIQAGKTDVPFDVHLPNNTDPYFSIKDYGVGLSETEVMDLYCTYGGTSKSSSNDFTGGFGLGSKSPFAYIDQFTITSCYGGTRTIYNAFIGENGAPQVLKTLSEPTTEVNGVEVYVPVKPSDFYDFKVAATKVFKNFPLTPNGVEVVKRAPLVDTKDYQVLEEQRYRATATVGYVEYPIDPDNAKQGLEDHATITDKDLKKALAILRCGKIDLKFNLGEVMMTVSRESLDYNTKTKEALVKKAIKVFDYMTKDSLNKLKASKTLAKAYETTYLVEKALPYEVFKALDLVYHGVDLRRGQTFDLTLEEKCTKYASYSFTSDTFRGERSHAAVYLYGRAKQVIIIDDLQGRYSLPKLLQHNKSKLGDFTTVFIFKTKNEKELIERIGSPEVLRLSDFEMYPIESKSSKSSHNTSTSSSNVTLSLATWRSSSKPVDVDIDNPNVSEFLYFKTYLNSLDTEDTALSSYALDLGELKRTKILKTKRPVYLVEGSKMSYLRAQKRKDKWVSCAEVINNNISKRIKNDPKIIKRILSTLLLNSLLNPMYIRSVSLKPRVGKVSPLHKYFYYYDSELLKVLNLSDEGRNLIFKCKQHVKKLENRVLQRYPSLAAISSTTYVKDKVNIKIEYIKLIDENIRLKKEKNNNVNK